MATASNLSAVPEDNPKPSTEADFDEIGVSSDFPTTTFDTFAFGRTWGTGREVGASEDDKPAFILGRDPEAVPLDKLVEMRRRDGQTSLLLQMFMQPLLSCLRSAEWIVPPHTKGGDKEVQFANDMFRLPPVQGGMSVPLRQVLRQTLLAVLEGFSAFEEVRQIPKSGPNKGKIVLRKLAHRDSRTLQFRVDETGGFNGFLQLAMRPDGTPLRKILPKEKMIFFNVQGEQNPLYGRSLFETAWYHYDIKVKWYYISQIAGQIAAVPGRMGEYPISASKKELAAFDGVLKNFGFNTYGRYPAGFKVSPFNSSSTFDFLKQIEHHSHLQAKSVMLQFVDSESRPQLIDNGSKDASADLFVNVLEALMDDISEIWSTHLLPKYIDWNFESGVYPIFRFGKLTDSDRDLVQSLFNTVMVSSTLNCTPEFVRATEEAMSERMGYDINYEEIATKEAEAAEDAAKLQAEQQNAQEAAGAPAPGDTGSAPGTNPAQSAAAAGAPAAPVAPDTNTGPGDQQDALSLSHPLLKQDDIDTITVAAQNLLSSFPAQFETKKDYYDLGE